MRVRDRITKDSWFVYALELENGCFYFGITTDVKRRFPEHLQQGKLGASFTNKNKHMKIIESYDTNTKRGWDAKLLEDITTLKYILKFQRDKVKGGKYL